MLRLLLVLAALLAAAVASAADPLPAPPKSIAPFFAPPEKYKNDFGAYRSPLKFADGTDVKSAADWDKRRAGIRKEWFDILGAWPELVAKPKFEILETEKPDGYTRHRVRVEVAPGKLSSPGYLLVPDGEGPFPAVVHVSYGPDSAAGLKLDTMPHRERGLELTKRGFVNLTMGGQGDYYPNRKNPVTQPLSFHAYVAANLYTALAARPEVDPTRVGICGHSYGGKWAMFASCLDDRFACGVWSDGGCLFDETITGVNYWEPFYLGFDPAVGRKRGLVTADNPRTGAYKKLVEGKHDLHELHALMAPRPFLVSGGPADKAVRWTGLNHAVAVNRLLGYENRVALTARATHAHTAESNGQIYAFFEWALEGKADAGK